MATFRAVILRSSNQVRSDGMVNIKIRIQVGNSKAYIRTDLYVKASQFKAGSVTGADGDYLNRCILSYLTNFTDRYLAMGEMRYEMTAEEIRRAVTATTEKQRIDFHDYADKYLKSLLDDGKIGTWRSAIIVIRHLKEFKSPLFFDEIDATLLSNFDRWLKRRGCRNAISTYMARLRVIFNRGRSDYNDEDRGIILIPNYPWRKYKVKIPEHRANQNSLTIGQVRDLLSYSPKWPREELAQDVFLIMLCLMGPNTKDLFLMPQPAKGRVVYFRSKTGHKFSVKLEPELKNLITKYQGKGIMFNFRDRYKDDQLFQAAINKGLRSICRAKKWSDVTTNWARHTWATLCRTDLGISRDDIGRCLGHSSRSVTDVYIRYNYEIEDTTNRKLLDYIFRPTLGKQMLITAASFRN
jgi:integrase